MKTHELKNIDLFEENGQYYLSLKYIIEDDYRVTELEIPKAKIPVNKNAFPGLNVTSTYFGNHDATLYAGGYGPDLELCMGETSHSSDRALFTYKTLKEKPQELTVAEIEKKLGYKVKIVSKK